MSYDLILSYMLLCAVNYKRLSFLDLSAVAKL